MTATESTQSERSGTVALLAAGISAAAIALLALLGWVLDAPALTAWGADTIPMAPSTAALSMLVGAALALCAPMRPRSGALRLATLAGWVGAVAALLLLLLRLRGEYWPVEHLGLPIGGTFRGAAVGYISPITAFCFLLANAVLLALLPAGARGSWRRWLAWSFGGLISVMGFALLLAYAFGAPLLFREAFIPPAFNTSLILLIVGLALLLLAGRLSREPRVSPEGAPKGRLVFVVMFVGFAAATITGGYSYYRQEERELRGEAGRQLDVVARLKATEVSHWRKERLADATVMLRSAFLSASFEHFLQRPGDAAMVGQLQEWLGSYQAYGQYDRAFLIDAHGATRLSLPASADPPSAAISRRASEVLRTGQVALQDFYLDERDQRVHLAILAPILDRSGASRPIGVLVLRIDPESFLYPFIESWPATSTTAEALLVRRDGADVLYLSDLRFDPNAALRRRVPLENARVLAVRAVLGETGGVDGLDYRGAPVLGSLHPIPDSPWYLIAHVDIAEFRAQLWGRVWRVIAFTIALLLGGGSALGLIGWNQRTRFYRKQAELTSALRASEERFRGFIENASDIVYGLTPGGIFTYVSPNWLDLMGEPATNAVGRSFEPYVHPDDVHLCKEFLERVLATGEPLGSVDYRALHRDGSTRWHSSKGSALRD
ncbi:MAG: PAS domain-containing protein, partial [Vicinamibacteria bacterium]|nr:PAS domain-containing protein [Vicinamibacteria bacterium]